MANPLPVASIQPTTTVADALARFPLAGRVFTAHRMLCVGCGVAPYETIADVCSVYGLPLDEFLAELDETVHDRLT